MRGSDRQHITDGELVEGQSEKVCYPDLVWKTADISLRKYSGFWECRIVSLVSAIAEGACCLEATRHREHNLMRRAVPGSCAIPWPGVRVARLVEMYSKWGCETLAGFYGDSWIEQSLRDRRPDFAIYYALNG